MIYELGANEVTEVGELKDALDIDAGQLSRVLARLGRARRRGRASPHDARRQRVELTAAGTSDLRADRRGVRAGDRRDARRRCPTRTACSPTMRELQRAIEPDDTVVIRGLEPGDLGWLVERHGVLYTREYRWDDSFERLVARIAADFDPADDRAFDRRAQRRARRRGAVRAPGRHRPPSSARCSWSRARAASASARRLVDEVIKHAQRRGYSTLTLWTNDVLHAARHIYEREGFTLAARGRAPRVRPRPHRADVVA